jgi:adenylate kinase
MSAPTSLERKRFFGSTETAMVRRTSKNSSARVILLMGAPGSGKGTQSARLTAQLGIPSVSTGDILREEAKRETPAGRDLRRILASGALVSDETVCAAIQARLERELSRDGLILDGFPRTVRQAEFLDSVLASMNMPKPMILHLEVSAEGLLRRLTARRQCAVCGEIYNLQSQPSLAGSKCEKDGGQLIQRTDDCEETILRRFAEYEDRTAPVIAWYRGSGSARGSYHMTDGDAEPETVAEELMAAVGVLVPVRR